MRTRSAERTEFLTDIICAAICGGINYWASVSDIVDLPEPAIGYASVTVWCSDGGREPLECTMSTEEAPIDVCLGHHVDADVIAHGVAVAMDSKRGDDVISLHASYRKGITEASRENDAGDMDAGYSDIVLQLGIFERVVYG